MKRLDYYTPFQQQAERVKDDIVAFLIDARKRACGSVPMARRPRATR